MASQSIAFQFFYTVLFTLFSVVVFGLTLLTPGDLIYQAYASHKLGSIFAISGVYIVTLLLVILIYASRIFTNRSVLAGIPKAWIPIENPDVGKNVRRLVVEGLTRSAVIAQQARPRDRSGEDTSMLDQALIIPSNIPPPWGTVSHPGWTAPDCPDLPNQEFEPVIKELPHLIEAKAVSLAPTDPRFLPSTHERGPDGSREGDHIDYIPDARVVTLLQRPSSMCLRDYMGHLSSLGLIDPPHLADSFLALYEKSRFSPKPLTETQFRTMMGLFAEMLRGMTALDPEIISHAQQNTPTDLFDGAASFDGESGVSTDSSSFVSAERAGSNPYRYPSYSSSGKASSFRLQTTSERQSLRSVSRHSLAPSTRSF
ncbi:hypothetical protein LOZ53_002441 [Ophidiomyces ophidiicola]|uniref:Uncharacterized protein n=1 Tax=Ophidiomyces ophidiicola TaxID=1387563 RepID=A0ACB8V1L1_9EURO|nr:uncharacterized protein LOZ57_004504 [Ophidiomyces ophidiicola]KAI1913502.1 hypothetical protein LOZ64_004121 [Ophidiomyces ophidiicola]KAI1917673.1 hypothetical protein LOZ61_000292 [Ophidiomyces ophidiicola]KAI1931382.1 hypothetical protein LOZ60_000247 [Ophidiomyces ophidiicola]KAI1944176.1 hypothetical protein LOZ62_004235 [Ophidiomyces ophidiicola]KAI1944832.1 hypothetical protein LOZ57_004504 [Ophidiomyces ophidiicola]